MLTRFVRIQLIIFTIASVVGVAVMALKYMQAPTLLGIGHLTVKLELPASGGLYKLSNVTYRGVQIGTVTDVDVVDSKHAEATLSLNTSPRIPSALTAHVRSVSAIGEQYVDLQPRDESGPYLADGSVISLSDTTIPQPVGPMLDQLNGLVGSIPQDKLGQLLDESFRAFDGAGYDFGSLLDSSAKLTSDLNGVADQTRTLVDDSGPLLDSQAQSAEAIHVWSRSLAGITAQVNRNDPQIRTLLHDSSGAADEVSKLLSDVKPTLPVLLANLTAIGQIGVTYNPSIEQLLVLLPAYTSAIQSVSPANNSTGLALGEFAATIADPPACTVGFLPPSAWRSPAETSEVDTPDGLYCKLPQDSPIAVRGARNYPCMGHPGKRAPTVQLCDDPNGFVPLAQRQHVLGPYPLDPNLIAQGVPPDDRVNPDANIYGPAEGTPLPPGAPSTAPPPGTGEQPPDALPPDAPTVTSPAAVSPAQTAEPSPPTDAPPVPAPAEAAPSSFATNGTGVSPSVAVAHYNPRTGAYMGSDGRLYHQSNLEPATAPRAWTDLVLGSQ
ncbi:MAG: mammalian cell entry protein [Mycobacterium sp.]|jgi:virulence factor Mce-like protein|nr:mammalian cell entry protein [Mycobacterium sp.]MDT5068969.1 phospholipid/cholesterol/gamma-HCH transport system substrate-binding protein [Mycobacterium sp.]